MKTRNLFLSLFAFAALCACNKEAQPEIPQVLEEDAYINVSIVSDNLDTRAATSPGFSDGALEENAVTNALFAFFDNTGKYLYSVDDKVVEWTGGKEDTPAVENISDAVVVLEKQSITPTQMVVVLNYGADIAKYFDDDKADNISNLADMYNVLYTSNFAYNNGGKNYFTMSNSSYWEGDKNAFAAQITESNIYTIPEGSTESEKAAIRSGQIPVEVYVERVAAKLSVVGNPTGTHKPLELINGTIIEYYPEIKNYGFTYTTDASWLCKNIVGLNTELSAWTGWNDPTHKRSYWAKNYTSANINKLEFGEITGVLSGTPTPSYDVYCHENTTGNPTKLIVSASIKNAANGSDLEIVRVGTNEYYIKDELLTAIAAKFTAASISKAADASNFTKDDFEIVKSEAGDAKSYESDIKIKTGSEAEAGKETEVDAILDGYKKVLYWGKDVYFYTDVEHFGTAATGTDKGVVRNHIYQLTVSSIAGLGTPYVPGIGGGGITPEVPAEVTHELQATINILKWKVVSQNVSFGE